MDAWSLMRGDAFIHFVCGSRRVNIRLGVLLLIPKSPQITRIDHRVVGVGLQGLLEVSYNSGLDVVNLFSVLIS